MGVDCAISCFKCNDKLDLGRAYHYNEEVMNKRLDPKTLEMLMLAIKKFELSLRQIPMFGEGYEMEWYDEVVEFLKIHEGHDLWLINDYYEAKK